MKNKSILLKSVSCALGYLLFSLLLLLGVYIIDFFESSFILGVLYGVIFVYITYCEKVQRTIFAMFMGLLSVVISHIILSLSGVPYQIILYLFRNDKVIQEMGHLSVNEVIGYNWGIMIFWFMFLVSFAISCIGSFIVKIVKSRVK